VTPPEEPQAAKTADRLRDEFLVTLRELDRRAHRAMDVRTLMRENRRVVIAAGAGLAAVVVVIIATSVALSRSRDSHLAERRLEGLRRAWKNPERIARRRAELSRPVRLLAAVLRLTAVAAGTQLVRRTVQRALPAGG
jgi:hypothetical protein